MPSPEISLGLGFFLALGYCPVVLTIASACQQQLVGRPRVSNPFVCTSFALGSRVGRQPVSRSLVRLQL